MNNSAQSTVSTLPYYTSCDYITHCTKNLCFLTKTWHTKLYNHNCQARDFKFWIGNATTLENVLQRKDSLDNKIKIFWMNLIKYSITSLRTLTSPIYPSEELLRLHFKIEHNCSNTETTDHISFSCHTTSTFLLGWSLKVNERKIGFPQEMTYCMLHQFFIHKNRKQQCPPILFSLKSKSNYTRIW